jgi:hypothetical protein
MVPIGDMSWLASRKASLMLIRSIVLSIIALGWLAGPPLYADPRDRPVAEWVILVGGSVRLEGVPGRIRDLTKLPADDFHLELVDLVGTNILPPDLKWLTGLTRLKVLNLSGPMWNPSSGATIDYSRDLKYIAHIPTLEELTFIAAI